MDDKVLPAVLSLPSTELSILRQKLSRRNQTAFSPPTVAPHHQMRLGLRKHTIPAYAP